MKSLTREERLLLNQCSIGLHGAKAEATAGEGVDWARFVELAEKHRIVPVVWRRLPQLNAPSWVRQHVDDAYRKNALRSLQVASHIVRIQRLLDNARISVTPLKGVCLAARNHADLASRHVGDLDSSCVCRRPASDRTESMPKRLQEGRQRRPFPHRARC